MTIPPDDDTAKAEQRRREGIERGRALFSEELARTTLRPPRRLPLGWLAAAAALVALLAGGLYLVLRPSGGLSDDDIRALMIRDSIAAYQATGRPCACPYDVMANGKECGDFSAYGKPGAAAPLCYARDIGDAAVRDWRRRNER